MFSKQKQEVKKEQPGTQLSELLDGCLRSCRKISRRLNAVGEDASELATDLITTVEDLMALLKVTPLLLFHHWLLFRCLQLQWHLIWRRTLWRNYEEFFLFIRRRLLVWLRTHNWIVMFSFIGFEFVWKRYIGSYWISNLMFRRTLKSTFLHSVSLARFPDQMWRYRTLSPMMLMLGRCGWNILDQINLLLSTSSFSHFVKLLDKISLLMSKLHWS